MSRMQRFCKRVAIGLALALAILLLVRGATVWRSVRRFENRLAILRAAGEPTCFADLAPETLSSADNAAVILDGASADLRKFAQDYSDFFSSHRQEALSAQREPTPEQVVAMRTILDRYPHLPEVIRQAADCKGYASRVDFTVGHQQMMPELLESVTEVRTPARFLRWRISVLLADGRQEDALADGLVILRLARLYEAEPALVNGLLANAIRAMAIDGINLTLRAGPISSKHRRQLVDELARQDNSQRIVHLIKTERAVNISAAEGLGGWAWTGRKMRVDFLDFYDTVLPLLARPWHESHQQLSTLTKTVVAGKGPFSPLSGSMIGMLVPSLLSANEAENRILALLRSARIVNALTQFAQEHGHEASGLQDLNLLEPAMEDPFSGKPLIVRWTSDGWVVYSVFKDGVDNGGDFRNTVDCGLGPGAYLNPESVQ